MSQSSSKVLVVDDQDFMQVLICSALEDDFIAVPVGSAAECLAHIDDTEQRQPDLILLDVNMPDMNGYDLCRELRQHGTMATIPIIFVSGSISNEDRLAGFEAGGDDYVHKPVDDVLLIDRINLHLKRRSKNRLLETQAKDSMNMAMEAMTFSSELGMLLQLMKESAEIKDFNSLINKVDEVNQGFGLSCSYLIADGDECRYFNCEEGSIGGQILHKFRDVKKIFDFGCRTIFNEERVSILVKNMPLGDDKIYGRLKDHLAILCTIADQLVRTLQATMRVEQQRHKMLSELIVICEQNLQKTHEKSVAHGNKVQQVMEGLIDKLEERLLSLGLEEDQEAALIKTVSDASLALSAEGSFSAQLEVGMKEIMDALNNMYDSSAG